MMFLLGQTFPQFSLISSHSETLGYDVSALILGPSSGWIVSGPKRRILKFLSGWRWERIVEIFILDGILGDFFRKVSDCAAGLRVVKNQKSDHAESCHYAETNLGKTSVKAWTKYCYILQVIPHRSLQRRLMAQSRCWDQYGHRIMWEMIFLPVPLSPWIAPKWKRATCFCSMILQNFPSSCLQE